MVEVKRETMHDLACFELFKIADDGVSFDLE